MKSFIILFAILSGLLGWGFHAAHNQDYATTSVVGQ
jgi:hypothetical protein